MVTHQSSSSTPARSQPVLRKSPAPPVSKEVNAAPAGRVGTLTHETWPTPNTEDYEEESSLHGFYFFVNYGEEGIYIDCGIDVTELIGKTHEGVMAAEKLTGVANHEANRVLQAISTMHLRSRFINTGSPGPYLVKTSSPLSLDELETYLRHLDRAALKTFLASARV